MVHGPLPCPVSCTLLPCWVSSALARSSGNLPSSACAGHSDAIDLLQLACVRLFSTSVSPMELNGME